MKGWNMWKSSKRNLAALLWLALAIGVARAGGDVQTGADATLCQLQDQSAAGRYAIRQTGNRIVLSAGVPTALHLYDSGGHGVMDDKNPWKQDMEAWLIQRGILPDGQGERNPKKSSSR